MGLAAPLASRLGWGVLALTALAAAGAAALRPEGGVQGLPSVGLAGAVLLGVTVAAGLCPRRSGEVFLGLGPILLLVAVALPLPGVRALSGAPLLALVLGCLAAALSRRAPARFRVAFFPVLLALYAGVAWRVQSQVGAEGDEPHYLMVAESLLRDGDLSLEGDYAEGRYRAFYRTRSELQPHYLVRGRRGEIYSQHAVGLSLLILPAYALGGYPAASLFMALLGAVLAREIRLLVRAWTNDEGLADGLGWIVGLSPPLVYFAGLVFTEVPAALGLALGLHRLRRPHRLGVGTALAVGAALAFLPWLNVRYAPLPALLWVWVLLGRPRWRVAVALSVPLVVSALALALYHFELYGFFDPREVYGRRPGFLWSRLPGGLEALFFDQEFGLLAYAPIFALALPGGVLLMRRTPWRDQLALFGTLAVVALTAATWRMWWGGFTPPARFLLAVLPVLALLLGRALRDGLRAGSALLLGWGLWLGLAGAWQPHMVHRDRDDTAPLLRAFSGAEEWTRLLPAFVGYEAAPDRHRLAAVWAAALALAAAAALRPGPRNVRAPGVTLAGLGMMAAAACAAATASGRTQGRDAVRVLARPAFTVPGWRFETEAPARWTSAALGWGPVYQPHRHPGGALLGGRLPLPAGDYLLTLTGRALPGFGPGTLELWTERGGVRVHSLYLAVGGLQARFRVTPEEHAVTLTMKGGGAFWLEEVRLKSEGRAGGPPKEEE